MPGTRSQFGFASGTLVDPANGYGSSQFGFVSWTLKDPTGGGAGSSPFGFVSTAVGNPNMTVKVMKADGLLYRVPIRTWDGTTLR